MHLDVLFWRAGWAPAPKDQATRDLEAAIGDDRWIIEGNFLDRDDRARFQRADTIIFLDFPRVTCLWRVLRRVIRDRRRTGADLPEGAGKGVDLELVRWIWSCPKIERPRVLAILERLDQQADIHRLRSPADVRTFLETMTG